MNSTESAEIEACIHQKLLYWQMKLCKQKVKVSSDLVLQGLHPSKGLTEVSKHLRLAKPP